MDALPTIVETIAPGGVGLTLERPATPDDLIDEGRFAADEFLPYWAELWPSGLALAETVARLEVAGQLVLELGCGLGVPSLVAAARRAEVLATDWAPEALELLQANARRNGLTVATARVDWRALAGLDGRRFDLVLAADVLYEARNVEPLLAALTHALHPSGEALVADPGRAHAVAFVSAAERDGLLVGTIGHPLLPRGGVHRCRLDRRGSAAS